MSFVGNSSARAAGFCLGLCLGLLLGFGVSLRAFGATFRVTNTNDTGPGSLRQAILDANAEIGADAIEFQVTGSGVLTISPLAVLPPVLDPVILDGATQPGYSGQPLIEINGLRAGNNSGLRLLAGSSTVRGLAITQFGGSGIQIEGPGTNVVQGCCLGVDAQGISGKGNALEGIWIYNSSGNLLGGTNALERNIISGNFDCGVYVQNGEANTILGNYIGTSRSGTFSVSNRNHGLVLYGARHNQVGGLTPAARNVISGNSGSGIFIFGAAAAGNIIQGNYIGTGQGGVGAVGNLGDGITLSSGGGSNLLGGAVSGAGNLVSANGKAGISLSGTASPGSVIQGNMVGTTFAGTAALGNVYSGIWLNAASSNVIGGTSAAARNVVSGNRQNGIYLGTNSNFNVLLGNLVGSDVSGAFAVSNLYSGIHIVAGQGNVVGAIGSGAGNLVSGNALYGLLMGDGASANSVVGNQIGTTLAGNSALPNGRSGVKLESHDNCIGPSNVLSGNLLDGLVISGSPGSNNIVKGNFVGTSSTGLSRLGNGRAGIGISAAPGNTIGGSASGEGNLVSANGDAGIYLLEPASARNAVLGNSIGTDVSGFLPLGNRYEGVYLQDAPANIIGGVEQGRGNLICGNLTRGIFGTNASFNVIEGNEIGISRTGSAVPNAFHNVELQSGSLSNIVSHNIIGFAPSPYAGIRIRQGSRNNRFDGNSIHHNSALGIDLGPVGPNPNDSCDADTGANNLQNSPTLLQALSSAFTLVRGFLNAAPNDTFELQFFASPECDDSLSGEGQVFVGGCLAQTDASCQVTFSARLNVPVPPGWVLTATATDRQGNTSEFSPCIGVYPPPLLGIAASLPIPGQQSQVLLTWTNTPGGFVLATTTNLTPPVTWSAVTNLAVLNAGNYRLSLPPSEELRFFTLQPEP